MPLEKSGLYSSLRASCDELRGGMHASQYKDHVLFMLFVEYISDTYGNRDARAPARDRVRRIVPEHRDRESDAAKLIHIKRFR
jgi:type I restriction-modification system DNA methylase subunit